MGFITNINYFKRNFYIISYVLIFFVFQSCATYEAQYGKNNSEIIEEHLSEAELSYRFYLIGDAGNANELPSKQTLDLFEKRTSIADENAMLPFLGDNIYDKGMPANIEHSQRQLAEEKLMYQLEVAKKFKGKTVFISGNHDWYHGIEGLAAQAEFVREHLGDKKAFLPR